MRGRGVGGGRGETLGAVRVWSGPRLVRGLLVRGRGEIPSLFLIFFNFLIVAILCFARYPLAKASRTNRDMIKWTWREKSLHLIFKGMSIGKFACAPANSAPAPHKKHFG